jgi:hypothetical protein|tara:strand:+ start:294 stop:527 length:234 start_codon:yes stop_codon:yes gene_type:complete
MNPDILLLVSVWDSVKNYVPKKDRVEAAEHIVRVFDEEADLGNIEDEVATFDAVLKTAVIGHFAFGEDEDDDEDDWG